MVSTNTTRTIEELRKHFTAHGLPEQLVSDNGPQFIATEFRAFMRSNGIKHIRSASYHPAPNGLDERFVLSYRTTPHTTTRETPAILLMGRNIRTRLDILKPNIRKRVEENQQDQELRASHSPTRQLDVGETVVARDYRGVNKWVLGVITARSGPLSYKVRVAPSTAAAYRSTQRVCHYGQP